INKDDGKVSHGTQDQRTSQQEEVTIEHTTTPDNGVFDNISHIKIESDQEDEPRIQSLTTPPDHTSEDAHEVSNSESNNSVEDNVFRLPFRKNRGKPPSRYSPEESKRKEVLYPINNYMSINQLMEPIKGFSFFISTLTIPYSVDRENPFWYTIVGISSQSSEEINKDDVKVSHGIQDQRTSQQEEVTIEHTTTPDNGVFQNISHIKIEKNKGKSPSRYSSEESKRREVLYSISNYMSINQLMEPLKGFAFSVSTLTIPESVEEALNDLRWVEAMKVEMNALEKNNTWKLVSLPKGKKSVGCKWVFSVKYDSKREFNRYKSWLVAKRYTQSYSIDYHKTFSPVAKLNTIRVLLSIAANLDWPLHQFDVNNAFLHGDLDDEIYMDIPPGYDQKVKKVFVCKLEKALYGLKQSSRDNELEITELEQKLSREFEMKNLGGLKYFLGFKEPKVKHMETVMHIISYLNGAPGRGIQFTKNENLKVTRYTDQVWAGNKIDCKSQAGYFTFIGGNLNSGLNPKKKWISTVITRLQSL
nr:putative RNA-directed DNA polymerase [Tanacetum cinerariifolium]